MLFFCSFSYRGKVIIKGVSNIIGIGYRVSPLSRDSTVGTLDATVFRNKRFDSFPCALNIIKISFKIFIIISLFTFLHKGGE